MSFQVKKIGKTEGKEKQQMFSFPEHKKNYFKKFIPYFSFKKLLEKKKKWHWYIAIPLLTFAIFLISNFVLAVYDKTAESNFTHRVFQPVLSNLLRDSHGFINILIVGQGGAGHDGGDLADTIMIASLDSNNKTVSMLSIPRDFWVNAPNYGSSRINEMYRNTKKKLERDFNMSPESIEEESMKVLMNQVEKIVDIQIPYYARIDFHGFKEIIDGLGGIEINNEKDIYDPAYPDGNWGYEIFQLKKGIQILDGATALKYARSRHGNSDFDRAARQQQVIQAMKEKATSLGVLTSPRKIKNLMEVVQKNFKTNLNTSELMTIAFLGKSIEKDKMNSGVLNNDWSSRGGLLANPPRASYGGASVLIPYAGPNNYNQIHAFSHLLFEHRDLQSFRFEVLNGTMRGGLGAKASERLERYGIPTYSVGNTPEGQPEVEQSELWVYTNFESFESALPLLQQIFPVKLVNKTGYYEVTDVTASFIIGKDFK